MFESYSIIDHRFYRDNKELYNVEIIDSSFKAEVVAEFDENGLNIMSPIISLYKSKGLNVAANVAKAYVYMSKRFNLEPKAFLERMIKINKDIAPYKEDIDKYLAIL